MKMVHVLFAAIAAAAVVGIVKSSSNPPPPLVAEPAAEPAPPPEQVAQRGTRDPRAAERSPAPPGAVHRTGTPDHRDDEADPHGSDDPDEAMKAAHAPLGAADTRPVKPVERAAGPSGKTVAELIAQRTQLAGKTVRIHGTVVKLTPGILGRTYLHLRDGSGDPAAGTHDITVTTQATPAVGETVLVEGVVVLDRDIGAGYKFPTLVEDAKLLPSP